MSKPIYFTGSGLDRADRLRGDAGWVAGRLKDAGTCVLPVWRDLNLVAADRLYLTGAAARNTIDQADEIVLLGLRGETPFFAADISSLDEDDANELVSDLGEFTDLRTCAPMLARDEGSILAYAKGMLIWHRRHRFCGDCGHPTLSAEAGHVRKCTNAGCAKPHFPRTDPAVIMLVTRPGPDGGSCLLGHKPGFLPGMYSTLAGFVEPGESLEETVAREVFEEAGVQVTDVRYRASQPWPFPASLMLGYRAQATTFDIKINPDELADAAWFTKADIARMPVTGKRLPRPDSIALWLINEWLAETLGDTKID
ncbi:MAG: NAD(+) diphosphatase [Rhodospirillales bacterium]|nr:NAD(+) diphosphatase [Rhodospirillales bacterium]